MSITKSLPRLAIVTALKEEMAAVEAAIPVADRKDVLLIRGGVGWNAAVRVANELNRLPQLPAIVCSTGFCGGVVERLDHGSVLLVTEILGEDAPIRLKVGFEASELEVFSNAISSTGISLYRGAIFTAKRAVIKVDEKQRLAQAWQVSAVDMETYAIASTLKSGMRFFGLRAVSDTVRDELPAEVGGFLDDKGNLRVGNIARFAMGGRDNLKTLWNLKVRADKAAACLTAAWKAVWPVLVEV